MDLALLDRLTPDDHVSGEFLAGEFGCSRAAIAKRIDQLRAAGILVEARPRRGYRLAYPYRWWRQDALAAALGSAGAALSLSVLPETPSTNDWLGGRLATEPAGFRGMAVTDFQTGGKGRRGRSWLSPSGRQLTCSFGIVSAQAPLVWIGVALAVGVVVASVLRQQGWPVRLKWPNDLMLSEAKLGGILVEMDALAEGPSRIVIGLGINEHLRQEEACELAREVAALQPAEPNPAYDRQALLLAIAVGIDGLLDDFPATGLAPWLACWDELDMLRGRPVSYQHGDSWLPGVAQGVDAQGCLLVQTDAGLARCHSGEVSVRGVPS